jgi:hypothetical protein
MNIEMNKSVIINKILELRGTKVMIDKDLAELYGVTTKRLNEQVKRNLKRFPEDFMFQVTEIEKELLIQTYSHLEGLKFSHVLPYVFTEHGAVMLASVLNSEIAVVANIQIVRVFIELRNKAFDNIEIQLELEKIKKTMSEHGEDIDTIFHHLNKLISRKSMPMEQIGYKK